MDSENDIGSKFVATYYRLLYRSPNDLRKLYDTHAIVTREAQKITFQVFQMDINKALTLNPFSNLFTVKIYDYSSYFVGDSLVVSVYGAWTDSTQSSPDYFFTQQFVLCKEKGKYMITSDIYYTFCATQPNVFVPQPEQMVQMAQVQATIQRTQSVPVQQQFYPQQISQAPQVAAQHSQQQQQQQQSQIKPRPHTPGQPTNVRRRLADLDPERSITILDLANYKGKDVVYAYSRFGKITNKNFTFNTVYIEYSTSEEAESAAYYEVPSSVLSISPHARVERGIKPKGNEYRRY